MVTRSILQKCRQENGTDLNRSESIPAEAVDGWPNHQSVGESVARSMPETGLEKVWWLLWRLNKLFSVI